jgi:hypothetical protein
MFFCFCKNVIILKYRPTLFWDARLNACFAWWISHFIFTGCDAHWKWRHRLSLVTLAVYETENCSAGATGVAGPSAPVAQTVRGTRLPFFTRTIHMNWNFLFSSNLAQIWIWNSAQKHYQFYFRTILRDTKNHYQGFHLYEKSLKAFLNNWQTEYHATNKNVPVNAELYWLQVIN